MAEVTFSFGLSEGYRTPLVEVDPGPFRQIVSLNPGRHTANLASFDIGLLHLAGNRRLLCRIEFAYSFDENEGLVTVCGTDFASPDGLRLVVAMENSTVEESHFCVQQPFDGRLEHDPHWGHPTRLMPGLPEFWTKLARAANDALIIELQKNYSVYERKRPPVLSDEMYQNLLVVHHDGEIKSLYEHGQTLEAGDSVYSIESLFGGTTLVFKGKAFANVKGSAEDEKFWKATSWIEIYIEACDYFPEECTSTDFPRGFMCNGPIIGGHVILGREVEKVRYGADYVLLLPICQRHNKKDHQFMKVYPDSVKAVMLRNYHNP